MSSTNLAPCQDAAVVSVTSEAPSSLVVPVASEASSLLTMIERLACDPSVDVAKLERLMELRERVIARVAQQQWQDAMSAAQSEMRPIAADADNPQTRSRYASYAQLDRALRPVYTKHGFSLSFNTGASGAADTLRVLCDVTHAGHTARYQIDMPADGKGAKGGDVMTRTHATGAAATYGMRYLLKMIFNVAVGEDDRDGNTPKQRPAAPPGFEGWWHDFQTVAEEGLTALQATWNKTTPEYRDYASKHHHDALAALKAKAKAVSK